jgi:thiol-disulfide isomerase/thioredoxin
MSINSNEEEVSINLGADTGIQLKYKNKPVNKLSIDIAREIAVQRKGECLSTKYINCDSKLKWRCYYGHEWAARLGSIKYTGSWCPKCKISPGEAITRKIMEILFQATFEKIKPQWLEGLELDGYNEDLSLAFEYDGKQHFEFTPYFHKNEDNFKKQKERDEKKNKLCAENGVLLIRISGKIKYKNIQNFIVEECKIKNINVPNSIEIDYTKFSDLYIPNEERYALLKKMVEDKEGILISTAYVSAIDPVIVKCKCNYEWTTDFHHLQNGKWCNECNGTRKHTIEKVREFIEKKGGKCLSSEYINQNEKLEIQCDKKGHIWKTSFHSLYNSESWCPFCAKNARPSIESIRAAAAEKGGKCLSLEYINHTTKLNFECAKGHRWWTIPGVILRGHWCGECASTMLTLEGMQEIAKKYGGKCLSPKYINNRTNLLWECSKGHVWERSPRYVRDGRWCTECMLQAKREERLKKVNN